LVIVIELLSHDLEKLAAREAARQRSMVVIHNQSPPFWRLF